MSEDNNNSNTEETTKNSKDFSRQEENWKIMIFCNISWEEASKVEGDDREFLLLKADEQKVEVLKRKKELAEQQMAEQQQQAMMQQQALMQQQQMMPQQMPMQQQMPMNGGGMPPQMPQRV